MRPAPEYSPQLLWNISLIQLFMRLFEKSKRSNRKKRRQTLSDVASCHSSACRLSARHIFSAAGCVHQQSFICFDEATLKLKLAVQRTTAGLRCRTSPPRGRPRLYCPSMWCTGINEKEKKNINYSLAQHNYFIINLSLFFFFYKSLQFFF